MQEVKVVELLPNGLTKVELPEGNGASFGLQMMACAEAVCNTPEQLAEFHRNAQQKMPLTYQRYLEWRHATARCEHPNLFGCKGHCVWCGEWIGELQLIVDNATPVQP